MNGTLRARKSELFPGKVELYVMRHGRDAGRWGDLDPDNAVELADDLLRAVDKPPAAKVSGLLQLLNKFLKK